VGHGQGATEQAITKRDLDPAVQYAGAGLGKRLKDEHRREIRRAVAPIAAASALAPLEDVALRTCLAEADRR